MPETESTRAAESDAPTTFVREPGGLWHREAPTFRWEAPKAACDFRVLHPCEAAVLTEREIEGEFMCPDCTEAQR